MRRPADFSRTEIEASEWLTLMSERLISLEDRVRFEAWLAADPEHERVFRAQKAAWGAMARMPHLLAEAKAAELASAPLQRLRSTVGNHPTLSWSAAAALVLVTFVALLAASPWASMLPGLGRDQQFATEVGQIKDVTLEDGSVVTLGASSRIAVVFRPGDRRVSLLQGQAFFEVARDSARPFFVAAGDTQIRVVGTKFDVNLRTDAVRVSVLEGRVEVTKPWQPAAPSAAATQSATIEPFTPRSSSRVLTAGEAVVAPRGAALTPTRRETGESMGDWRSGRLVYVDARLRDVVADMNRYYDGEIVLTDEAIGELLLTAAFRTDQIDRMTEVLTTALPIDVSRDGDGRILLSLRRN